MHRSLVQSVYSLGPDGCDTCMSTVSLLHALQVLHVLGHCVCDPPSRRLHLPLHSYDFQEHCGGQWPGHAPAAVLYPAGWLCHCQALHPPMGCVVSIQPCCHHHLWHYHLPRYAALLHVLPQLVIALHTLLLLLDLWLDWQVLSQSACQDVGDVYCIDTRGVY